jgi:hypothetical protein
MKDTNIHTHTHVASQFPAATHKASKLIHGTESMSCNSTLKSPSYLTMRNLNRNTVLFKTITSKYPDD